MKKSETYYYKSCNKLPLDNFYEILNTKNYAFLIKNYDDDIDDVEITEELKAKWIDIYNEYIILLGNKVNTKGYTILAQVNEMEEEVRILLGLIDIYAKYPFENVGEQIDKWGYNKDDLEASLKKLEGLQFRVRIMRSKNPDLFKVEEEVKEEEKTSWDLYKDIVIVESGLNNGTIIDEHKTVVTKWVNYILMVEKKNGKRSN